MRRFYGWLLGSVVGLGVAAYFAPTHSAVPQETVELKPRALVQHKPIDEMSGIARSRVYEGVYWVHNDSGDRPRIFPIRRDGSVVIPPFVSRRDGSDRPEDPDAVYEGILIEGAANIDWEDIATDGDMIYIADVGNNGNARRDLAVYVVQEPNPEATLQAHVLKRIPVAYPDQKAFPGDVWRFDCEAVFVFHGKLYFLTKHRAPRQLATPESGTKLYRLDTQHTDRVNMLTLVDSHSDLGGWVTAAAMSPDGRTLAVLCQAPQQSVWLFDRPERGDKFLTQGKARRILIRNGKQCEAIEWIDNKQLLITNEQRELFVLDVHAR
ncbi:MAG: hypothetical protein KatS3mg019_2071 [Fimbriimonadales bacterium]|nr:MAG: hypothetical protein KatS3mg019_2071 [Fimbriimonadales bacterium]